MGVQGRFVISGSTGKIYFSHTSQQWRYMRACRPAILALMVMAALTQGQTRRSNEPSSAEPEYFQFGEGHAYMGSDRVAWEDGRVIFVRRVADMTGRGTLHETSEKLDPSQDDWKRFWEQVDTAGAWQWQASYKSARSGWPDGESWSLELRHADRRVKSQGYNAVPATYSEFRKAVYELMDAARRNPAETERHKP
jgi:hypothetical protein